jgi:NADPH-dependent ferric siderophore reductase
MSDTPSRGFQGAVLKLLRAGDYQLTVTGRRELSPHYLRLSFDGGGLLTDRPLHPTMWIRMWFTDGDKQHQRGYTLVDPDPATDTVDIEFALHDGVASRWAQQAQPGDTIEVTVLGSNFTLPEPAPKGYVIVGDTASLPAINSLLTAIGNVPAKVFLEAGHDDDKQLPVARSTTWCGLTARTAVKHSRRRSAHRRSTRPTTSAGSHAITEPPVRWPRSSARTTTSLGNPLRPKRTGWRNSLGA